jgi:acetolactate synthase I/III small subunit
MSERHTVAFLVENRPGVLFNISNLFRRKNFNIHSITAGTVTDNDTVRITIVVQADSRGVNQVVELLDKMVEVIEVKRLDTLRTVTRELALVKLTTNDPMAREEALKLVNDYHGLILNIESDNLIAEVTGETVTIDAFLEAVRSIGIEEVSRTGVTALEKGRLRLEKGEQQIW